MELAGKNQAGIDTSISPEQPDLLELNLSHIANFHVALQCQSVQFLIFWPLLIKRVCVCVCVCVVGIGGVEGWGCLQINAHKFQGLKGVCG